MKTLQIASNPCVVMTAHGTLEAKQEATVHMKGLNIFAYIKLEQPLQTHNGVSFECRSGPFMEGVVSF